MTVTGLLLGTRRLFDFARRNPRAPDALGPLHPRCRGLARIDKFVSLNTAIEVDLTGQIDAETAGGKCIGAVGGAVDFILRRRRSRGGLPIVALQSRARGKSKIVAPPGPASTSRADAGLIVTEHGVADLRHLSIRERIARMIEIAHPDDREALGRAAYDMGE